MDTDEHDSDVEHVGTKDSDQECVCTDEIPDGESFEDPLGGDGEHASEDTSRTFFSLLYRPPFGILVDVPFLLPSAYCYQITQWTKSLPIIRAPRLNSLLS